MRIGYACLTVGVPDTALHTCIMKNATEERLAELIGWNLAALDAMLDYNITNDIRLFRISSDIIPFGSSPANTLEWDKLFAPQLAALGDKARENGLRLSMHPGQYTVINSPNPEVVERAVEDLRYHTRFLDSLGLDATHKIVLHIGGIYGDKTEALQRFAASYRRLDAAIRARLIIENDDKLYSAADVLTIAETEGIPMVYDNLHHQVHGSDSDHTEAEWIVRAGLTWRLEDGPQKLHYSQQDLDKKPGSHSHTVGIDAFLAYYSALPGENLDIMLEVKDKNLSAVKCILSTQPGYRINALEGEWARYKYTVLERSPAIYGQLRGLLKDKNAYPAAQFYRLLDQALATELTPGNAVNAAQHVWGYCKAAASEKEMIRFARELEAFVQGKGSLPRVKGTLRRLAEAYDQSYLLQSHYFTL